MTNPFEKHLIALHEPISPSEGLLRGMDDNLVAAAVLVPLIKDLQGNWQVLFTRRADHLKHHPGQISFPGGRFEKSDINLCQTAIRETEEEIGIPASNIQLIGRLPQEKTVSQYIMTPYVGIVDSDYCTKIDHNEVAEIFTVPLNFLKDPINLQQESLIFNGIERHFYVIQYQSYRIWGATAQILVNFFQCLQDI